MSKSILWAAVLGVAVMGVSTVSFAHDCKDKSAAKAGATCTVSTVASTVAEKPATCGDGATVAAKAEGGCGDKKGSCESTVAAKEGDKKGVSCESTVATAGDAKDTKKDGEHKHDASCGHGPKDIVATVAGDAKLTTLAGLLKSSGLDKELTGESKFTVLAPTDDAFAKLSESTLETLSKPENKAQLRQILVGHVIAGETSSCCLKDGQIVKAINGAEIKVVLKDGKVILNGATVLASNVQTANGMVHTIDTVLVPGSAAGE
jgi:uncharacterized surface protein with fasciclin (FAS1) repeats